MFLCLLSSMSLPHKMQLTCLHLTVTDIRSLIKSFRGQVVDEEFIRYLDSVIMNSYMLELCYFLRYVNLLMISIHWHDGHGKLSTYKVITNTRVIFEKQSFPCWTPRQEFFQHVTKRFRFAFNALEMIFHKSLCKFKKT